MRATRLYFENHTEAPIWLLLVPREGTLEIHVHDGPEPHATPVPAKKLVFFPVDDAVNGCVHRETVGGVPKDRLEYQLIGHNDRTKPLAIIPGAVRYPDGPIFQISSETFG